MTRVLVTAFEPYGAFPSNASWLALVELTRERPSEPQVTTRRYPVDFGEVRRRLAQDLEGEFDFAIHLGQAPGSSRVQLESIGLNVGGEASMSAGELRPLEIEGPLACRSDLPLAAWAERLRREGIPAEVSYHAGTYLCNATLYWSLHLSEQMNLRTRSVFIHLPLDLSQTVGLAKETPCLPASISAHAVRLILEETLRLPVAERSGRLA